MSSLVFLESSTVQHILLLGRYSLSLMALVLELGGFLSGHTFCPYMLLEANTFPSLSTHITLLLLPLAACPVSSAIHH